ncbi:hypothetical protein FA95DRAFT_222495 [Auriscalpium vulgare]|uniref:Uncharacterized protein n=1 Tax=Auriscalpium vulgare TaxID=40419 RepID=A0ACB8RM82_9AGAM|nr:hypothetical protein FA95DRAFT_222495 [Auriscalpium vulgare]
MGIPIDAAFETSVLTGRKNRASCRRLARYQLFSRVLLAFRVHTSKRAALAGQGVRIPRTMLPRLQGAWRLADNGRVLMSLSIRRRAGSAAAYLVAIEERSIPATSCASPALLRRTGSFVMPPIVWQPSLPAHAVLLLTWRRGSQRASALSRARRILGMGTS